MSRLPIPRLGAEPDAPFPPAQRALAEPNGLLAFGGDLGATRLLNAYRCGIFPWYSAGQPILWWSPDPRFVFDTDAVHLTRRFRRELRASTWVVRADTAFEQVIAACARSPRPGQDGTWITPEMQAAYAMLHRLGHAHSIEVFAGDELVGGLYGVAVGRLFCGESMVSLASGGSKVALAAIASRLCEWGWPLLDAQVGNPHLEQLGARMMRRADFLDAVASLGSAPGLECSWRQRFGELAASSLA